MIELILGAVVLLAFLGCGIVAMVWPEKFDASEDLRNPKGLVKYYPGFLRRQALRPRTTTYRRFIRGLGAVSTIAVLVVLVFLLPPPAIDRAIAQHATG